MSGPEILLNVSIIAFNIWFFPGMIGGAFTAFALRRELPSLPTGAVVKIAGGWLVACLLGGTLFFVFMILLSEGLSVDDESFLSVLIQLFSFALGGAAMGAVGGRIMLSTLDLDS